MIRTIVCKICTCDVCDREKNIEQGADLPDGWVRLRLGEAIDFELCGFCALHVGDYVEKLMYRYKGEKIYERRKP